MVFGVCLDIRRQAPNIQTVLYPHKTSLKAIPKYISGRTSYLRARLAYYRYSQVIPTICNSYGFGLPSDFDYWEAYDTLIIGRCDKLIVLMMNGWEESKGVQAEIIIARKLKKPIEYMAWNGAD